MIGSPEDGYNGAAKLIKALESEGFEFELVQNEIDRSVSIEWRWRSYRKQKPQAAAMIQHLRCVKKEAILFLRDRERALQDL